MTGEKIIQADEPGGAPQADTLTLILILALVYLNGAPYLHYWTWKFFLYRSVLFVFGVVFVRYRFVYGTVLFLQVFSLALRLAFYSVYLALYSLPRLALSVLLSVACLFLFRYQDTRRTRILFGILLAVAVTIVLSLLVPHDLIMLWPVAVISATIPGLAYLFRRMNPGQFRLLAAFMIYVIMIQNQDFFFRFCARDGLGKRYAAEKQGITRIFGPEDEGIPSGIMCVHELGYQDRIAVTPHNPARQVAILEPGRPTATVTLNAEDSVDSILHDGRLLLSPYGLLQELDVKSLTLKTQMHISIIRKKGSDEVLYFHLDPRLNRIYATDFQYCDIVSLDTYEVVHRIPTRFISDCVPGADGREIIHSMIDWIGREIRIYDALTFERKRSRKYLDGPIGNINYDEATNRIYTSSIIGLLRVIDASSLEIVNSAWFRIGFWKALPDPKRPFLYCWNFFTGEIFFLDKNDLKTRKRIELGPNLRNITFSLDGDFLLAATKAGGFRISLKDLPED